VDVNEAFSDVIVPHHRYALAMARGQAQGWCRCGGVPARRQRAAGAIMPRNVDLSEAQDEEA